MDLLEELENLRIDINNETFGRVDLAHHFERANEMLDDCIAVATKYVNGRTAKIIYLQQALDSAHDKLLEVCGEDAQQYECESGRDLLNSWWSAITRLKLGRWTKKTGDFVTPGGTPVYVCAQCGGSEHLYGVEYPKRKVFCDQCGYINFYPWEQLLDEKQ